jgi:hypothetical protein
MFRDVPRHDWASHPADMYRYAAVIEEQMVTERRTPTPPRSGGPAQPRGEMSWAG